MDAVAGDKGEEAVEISAFQQDAAVVQQPSALLVEDGAAKAAQEAEEYEQIKAALQAATGQDNLTEA